MTTVPEVEGRGRWLEPWSLLAMILGAIDLSRHLYFGWVPHDEGALGLAARLVRDGQWPHRDFTDIYSGGLALVGAGAQALVGDDLRALRVPLALAAILWIPLFAACARRFTSPRVAAGLALLAFWWGPPLYPASMPSWYLLFLATAVLWALFRWQEDRRVGWWVVVGALVGLGLAIKINALLLLAAAGSVLLLEVRGRALRLGAGALLAGAGVTAAWVVARGWATGASLLIVLPLLVTSALLGRALWRTPPGEPERAAFPLRPGLALLAGLAVVLLPWIGAYWMRGALAPLLEGLLVLPFRRLDHATMRPTYPELVPWAGAVLTLGILLWRWSARDARAIAIGAGVVVSWWAYRAQFNHAVLIQGIWTTLRIVGPALVILGLLWSSAEGDRRSQALRAAAVMAAWFALLQFPYSVPMYFAYTAPLLILVGAAVLARRGIAPPIAAALAGGLALWILVTAHGQWPNTIGYGHYSRLAGDTLTGPHGGLVVRGREAAAMSGITATLDRWNASRIVAGPDAPEVYYLAGRPLPDREFFEFMAPAWSAERFAERIIGHRPDALVLNTDADFSRVPLDSVVARLPWPATVDTMIGNFRLLRFATIDARP